MREKLTMIFDLKPADISVFNKYPCIFFSNSALEKIQDIPGRGGFAVSLLALSNDCLSNPIKNHI